MAILRSRHKADKIKPHAKSFKELVSRLGQRSQLTAPGYVDSIKLSTAFIWGRWIKYVDSYTHDPNLSLSADINNIRLRFYQKVYEESSHFISSDSVNVCKNYLNYETVRSFLEWSY